MANLLLQQLETALEAQTLIGICPYADGDATWWGRVRSISDGSIEFAQVDPLGREDETETVPLSRIIKL